MNTYQKNKIKIKVGFNYSCPSVPFTKLFFNISFDRNVRILSYVGVLSALHLTWLTRIPQILSHKCELTNSVSFIVRFTES